QFQAQLSAIGDTLFSSENLDGFFASPLIRPSDKEKAISEALAETSVAESIKSFCTLLAKKGRLSLFPEIVQSFQTISDATGGVVRGTVKSPKALGPDEKKALTERIQNVTKKNPV